MINTILHKAESRGFADHGWLKARHTFSFANYYNPERIHFGVLRVLNDDTIGAGEGFGTHPHDNMEIITIPLKGDLEHRDSMGNASVIRHGEVQVMSAGTGITHSEFNHNKNEELSLLQIWVFPDKKDVEPRYGQITLNSNDRKNKFQQIVSPDPDDEGLWIHQQAWFYLADLDNNFISEYRLNKKDNGVYFFLISGEIIINEVKLNKRDGIGVWDTDNIKIETKEVSELLIMEIPLKNK